MKETFGQRFSRLRKQRGLTQEELGERFGISGQAVSKWENDASMPDISILPELSDVLGVSLNELLGKEEPVTRIVPVEERKNTDEMVLRVRVDSADGDKITVNLPMKLVKLGILMGMKMPQVSGNEALKDIDFEEIIKLVDEGLVGEIVTVESADGDHVRVFVE
ncbi:MAG: helix-turn-helix transcriptional regulator [Firmicutes bacterium]|nr:helix-turn-helix transcriptional regulator [Bacillota bacterium]